MSESSCDGGLGSASGSAWPQWYETARVSGFVGRVRIDYESDRQEHLLDLSVVVAKIFLDVSEDCIG